MSHLVIKLLDNPQGNGWGRSPQKSISEAFLADWGIVVNQFCLLRGIPSVKIYIPERSDVGTSVGPAVRRQISIQELMRRQEPFGTYLYEEDEWRISDRELRERLEIIFGQLGRELDYAAGPTANMMRLERFTAWLTMSSMASRSTSTSWNISMEVRDTFSRISIPGESLNSRRGIA
jgi:hypothetical protein